MIERVAANNSNFGGGYIEHADEQYTVRGLGRVSAPADLENTVVLAHDGVPVLLRDVGIVVTVPPLRYGATLRETEEAVSATVIALKGENGRAVIDRIKSRLSQIHFPDGYRLRPFYDQSEIINGTIHTVLHNLLEAGLLVTAILLFFLGDLRAALIVAMMIPLSILFGFIGMAIFGVSANLMSLGAIDFGMIVDGSVVMIENSVHHLEKSRGERRLFDSIRAASHEVARPILFGVAIIIAVYFPIFTLQGLEGRMFRPMAITVCSALLGSLILALTVVPALSTYFLKARIVQPRENRRQVVRRFAAFARPVRPLAGLRVESSNSTCGASPCSGGFRARFAALHRYRIHAETGRRLNSDHLPQIAWNRIDRIHRH